MSPIILTIIKVILSIGFTVFGVAKVVNIPNITGMQKETFTKFGLNKYLMMLTGLGELVGVFLLWVPIFSKHDNLGAALLAVIAFLGVVFHIKFKDEIGDLAPAIIMTSLSLLVALLANS